MKKSLTSVAFASVLASASASAGAAVENLNLAVHAGADGLASFDVTHGADASFLDTITLTFQQPGMVRLHLSNDNGLDRRRRTAPAAV